MAICVEIDASGVVVVTDPQPANVGSCQYVLVSGGEWGNNLWNLSLEGGVDVSVAILLCWVLAWGFRQAIRALSIGDVHERSHDA